MHKGITVADLLKLNKPAFCDYIYGVYADSGLFSEDDLKLLYDVQTSVIKDKQEYTEYKFHFHSANDLYTTIRCELVESIDNITATCWECALLNFQNNCSTKYQPYNFLQILGNFVENTASYSPKKACLYCERLDNNKTYHLCLLCFDCMCEDCFLNYGSTHNHTNKGNPTPNDFFLNAGRLDVVQSYNIVQLLKDKVLLNSSGEPEVSYHETKKYGHIENNECVDCPHKKFIKKYFISDTSDKDKGHWWGKFKFSDL